MTIAANDSSYHCDHETTEIRLRTYSNGTTHCVEQCLWCGATLRQYRKIAREVQQARANGPLFDFDETLQDKFYAGIHQRRTQQRQEKDEAWWAWYNEYLCSDAWSNKRRQVLARDNYNCQGCLQQRATRVHHLSYKNVGDELLFQLVSLCQECHDKLHDKDSDDG